MKKIKFFFCLITLSLFVGCTSDDDTTTTTSAGDIVPDFSFTNDEALFVFTNLSEGATTYRWDFGDLNFYCEKENPTYRYVTSGGEIDVTLTAMDEDGHESYITKTITAPEVLDVEITIDGNLDDWAIIDYLYEEPNAVSIQKIKIWGKGDYINMYLEGNTAMLLESVSMYFDSDSDSTTGFQSWEWPEGSGGDYVFLGALESDIWGAFFQHTHPTGGWLWAELSGSGDNIKYSGIISVDADTNAAELSIPKTQFTTLGRTIGLAITAEAGFPTVTSTSKYITYEIPIEAIGICE